MTPHSTCFMPPAKALRDDLEEKPESDPEHAEPKQDPAAETSEDRTRLLCKACRSRITRQDLGMEVDGSHRHVFFNPHGEVFELGCFASAKNILPTGPRSDEFTWFPGFEWQVIACTGCLTQLGWRYTGQHGGFFGLIVALLIEER
ncbi:hypothetical protein SYK_22570 [Pseudodesulfovibrio nedwellii]|uniref:CULT domain-containing protein n=1 Tax=Pseudodesulfovibrio nedwellii TaxID=2973072 RepID=A0ABM8B2Q3_9BACT|nr:cereblon family protein [Pseudodesulfovibrio nedwellii]BDQ37897.1 hypothetical protein SYK_22570 [Pseudodesulfovibrio nedwellii]